MSVSSACELVCMVQSPQDHAEVECAGHRTGLARDNLHPSGRSVESDTAWWLRSGRREAACRCTWHDSNISGRLPENASLTQGDCIHVLSSEATLARVS